MTVFLADKRAEIREAVNTIEYTMVADTTVVVTISISTAASIRAAISNAVLIASIMASTNAAAQTNPMDLDTAPKIGQSKLVAIA